MEPKPAAWGDRYAAVFGDRDVVDRYHLRPPYPAETFEVLSGLARGRAVLDVGCGPGDISRPLAGRGARVDAVDPSEPMLALARAAAGGERVRWIHGRVEEVELTPPYGLVTAGDSVHWLDWKVAFPLFVRILDPDGVLALVHRNWLQDAALRGLLRPIYERHSWNVDFEPLDPVVELERRGLFEREGEHETAADPWRPTLDKLVESHFSASGLARSRLRDRKRSPARREPRSWRLSARPNGTSSKSPPRSCGAARGRPSRRRGVPLAAASPPRREDAESRISGVPRPWCRLLPPRRATAGRR